MTDDKLNRTMALVVSLLARGALLVFVAAGGLVGVLMAGFAGDSPTASTWPILLAIGGFTLAFVASGVAIALTPANKLFSGGGSVRTLRIVFAVSVVIPILVVAVVSTNHYRKMEIKTQRELAGLSARAICIRNHSTDQDRLAWIESSIGETQYERMPRVEPLGRDQRRCDAFRVLPGTVFRYRAYTVTSENLKSWYLTPVPKEQYSNEFSISPTSSEMVCIGIFPGMAKAPPAEAWSFQVEPCNP